MACTAAQSRILGFLTKSVAVLGQQGGQIGQALQGVLADGRLPVSDLQPAVVPACVLMPGLLLDPRDPLMQSLADCVDDLHWKSPGFGRIPDAVSRQMAVVEILGPDGMFVHQRVRLGMLLQVNTCSTPTTNTWRRRFTMCCRAGPDGRLIAWPFSRERWAISFITGPTNFIR